MTAPKEEKIQNPAGQNLFVRSWRPDDAPKAVVAICHGFNSHSGYYFWVAEQLTARGFAVYALDLRGRGQSDGERFYVDRVGEYEDDLAALIRLAKAREPGLPVFLLGHSAGGVTACIYALDYQQELAGLISESFAFEVPAPDFALAVLKGISHIAPHAHLLKLKNADFSRDPAVVARMDADPLIAQESEPAQTAAALVHADERLRQEFPDITLPLLILHGTADKATRPAGSQLFHDKAGSKDKTLKFYQGYYHDCLNDLGKEAVMADIVSWLEARI